MPYSTSRRFKIFTRTSKLKDPPILQRDYSYQPCRRRNDRTTSASHSHIRHQFPWHQRRTAFTRDFNKNYAGYITCCLVPSSLAPTTLTLKDNTPNNRPNPLRAKYLRHDLRSVYLKHIQILACEQVTQTPKQTSSKGLVSLKQLSHTSLTTFSAVSASGHAGFAATDIAARRRTQAYDASNIQFQSCYNIHIYRELTWCCLENETNPRLSSRVYRQSPLKLLARI